MSNYKTKIKNRDRAIMAVSGTINRQNKANYGAINHQNMAISGAINFQKGRQRLYPIQYLDAFIKKIRTAFIMMVVIILAA